MAKGKKKLKKKDAKKGSWRFPDVLYAYSDDEMIASQGDRYFNAEIERGATAGDLPPGQTRRVAKYRLVEEGEITNDPTYQAKALYDPDENENEG